MFKKLRAFSLVELMMILLVASLIIAALVPVVTKKHFRLPSLVNHGAYMCYYENGKLKEAKWAGKFQQQPIFNRETDNCVFIPPKKAAYFQISAIGGGGGGGDAGYRGGSWESFPESGTSADPFGITRENLITLMDIEGLPDAEIDGYIEDWKKYAGHLMGYAESQGSGDGGNIGYTTASCTNHCFEYEMIPHEKKETVTYNLSESTDTTCTYIGTCSYHLETVFDYNEEKTRKYCDPCEETIYSDPYDCTGTHQEKDVCTPCVKPSMCSNCGGHTGSGGGGADAGGGCISVPCDVSCGETCTYKTVPDTPKQWCTKPIGTKGENVWHTEKYTVPHYKEIKVTDSCKSVSEDKPTDGPCPSSTEVVVKTWTEYEEGDCKDLRLTCGQSHTYASGGSGGSGVSCESSSYIAGGLGVTKKIFSTPGVPANGAYVNQEFVTSCNYSMSSAPGGTAACGDGNVRHDCGSDPGYSYSTITKDGTSVTAKAFNAPRGGTGASINGTYYKDDEPKTCYNTASSGSRGTDGSCASGSTTASLCTGSTNGYCLHHYYDPSTTWDPDGMYYYYYGYDQNYLQSGNAGDPGQFKTTIVRSLKNVDLTIKVGRGGSAAAYNSGGSGASGSTSTLGAIISASGGSGGSGSQIGSTSTLPTYRKARYEKESLCYYYDKYLSKNPDGSYRYTDAQAKKLQDKITNENQNGAAEYCEGLINNQNGYQYFRIEGNKTGAYPTPVGVFSTFMNIAFSNASSSDLFNRFMKFGRGGTGGGVEHRCWAGRHDVVFEKQTLKASVFVDQATANAHGVTDNSKYVPDGCRNDYSNIPASPGVDGAILIKW